MHGASYRRAALQLGIGLTLGGSWAALLLNAAASDGLVHTGHVPATVALTLLITASVGIAACAAPTLRGLRIQPREALRER